MREFTIGCSYLIEGDLYTLKDINPLGHYFVPHGKNHFQGWYLAEGDGLELVKDIIIKLPILENV